MAFSPDGRILAAGSESGVFLWDVDTGRQLAVFEGHARRVAALAVAPDGQLLASVSVGDEDGTVLLWDMSPHVGPRTEVQVSMCAAATVAGGEDVEVTVHLSRDPQRTLTVPVTAAPDSRSGVYSGVPASVTFLSGQTRQSFTLTAAVDANEEGEEVAVTLGFGPLPGGVSAGIPAAVVVRIVGDAGPQPETPPEGE